MTRICTALFLILAAHSLQAQEPIRNYSFKFKITNLSDSTDSVAYLANYYGSKQYYYDTATFEKGGILTFTGDTINGGIYSIILSDRKSYFEFVVNEPNIEMETSATSFIPSMKVKTSEENKYFYEYLRFIEVKAKAAEDLKTKLDAAAEGEKETLQKQLGAVDEEVMAYKKQFITDHPTLFISKVFKASAEPDVPEYSEIEDKDERQKKRYQEFKSNYLNDVDFTDERLLRTPVLNSKMTYYLTKLTVQAPDSIIKEADMLVARARPNREVFKYVVHTITSKYEDSKIMGMEAVLVHMGQKYYCNGDAYWLSEKKLEEFCDRVDHMAPLLIGKQATNLILADTSGNWRSLYDVKAKYTVLYFWDSGCGHCKKVTPKLKEFYEQYHSKGVEVYAVGTELENAEWKKYIQKNDLPWINVSDSPEINKNAQELMRKGVTTLESLNFRDTYDIFSTPKSFLLDENKKIIATKLMPEQLGEFIDNLIDQDTKSAEQLNQ